MPPTRRRFTFRPRFPSTLAFALLCFCGPAAAAGFDGRSLTVAWVVPFAGLLASIALLPLLAPGFWHRHFGKVGLAWAAAFLVPFALSYGPAEAVDRLVHATLAEYLPFVVLLFALYTVSGGIALLGPLHGSPRTNVALLAAGALLANVMGTTGAAMLLVRPLIRANAGRRHNVHVVVFFIFIVGNAGGALTPLGDPPLFLGFLGGVSFFWTIDAMLAPTAALCGALLAIFYALDRFVFREAPARAPAAGADASNGEPVPANERLRLEGRANIVLLVAIIAAVLISGVWRPGLSWSVRGTPVELQNIARDLLLVVIAFVSLRTTSKAVHAANGFNWAPMQEVAKLFAAIFVTIIPVIAMLQAGADGAMARLVEAVATPSGALDDTRVFWLVGLLSAFLDNAPTYLVFFHLAGADAAALMAQRETLQAISAGAVFMGALSYLGNAPNFMVRAIAVDRGIEMPSFFGYFAWSIPILLPLFAVLTALFFR